MLMRTVPALVLVLVRVLVPVPVPVLVPVLVLASTGAQNIVINIRLLSIIISIIGEHYVVPPVTYDINEGTEVLF